MWKTIALAFSCKLYHLHLRSFDASRIVFFFFKSDERDNDIKLRLIK